jgi:hypothetical protein
MSTKTKVTRIQIRRLKGSELETFMVQKLHIDTYVHNELVYNTGLAFLNDIFPENDPTYNLFFRQHEASRMFWNWWKNEWYLNQQDLVLHVNEHSIPFTLDYWRIEMGGIAFTKETQDSFQNFLKLFGDEIPARP